MNQGKKKDTSRQRHQLKKLTLAMNYMLYTQQSRDRAVKIKKEPTNERDPKSKSPPIQRCHRIIADGTCQRGASVFVVLSRRQRWVEWRRGSVVILKRICPPAAYSINAASKLLTRQLVKSSKDEKKVTKQPETCQALRHLRHSLPSIFHPRRWKPYETLPPS